ncbi:MAG: Transcriptional regulatory protein MoaR1 [Anaerolineales bacterium]|nr:Transcriptional regulatory protein MoaR1 [Anaerolineales bacterium]
MPTLQISLLGIPEIKLGSEPVKISSAKAQALLYYLVATRQPQTRDKVASLFWPETQAQQARGSLRNTLYNLRRAFDDFDPLVSGNQTIRFATELDYWLDIEGFERHVSSQAEDPAATSPASLEALKESVDLYRGEFLEGFSIPEAYEFEDWIFFERDRLGRLYLSGLRSLSSGYEAQGEYRRAIQQARAMLTYDPLQESVHRRLMRLYHAAGDRAAALRQYETLRDLLDRELGAEPLQETHDLYAEILRRPSGTSEQAAQTQQAPARTPAPAFPPASRPRFEARPVPEYLQSPLIGREAEFEQFQTALNAARQGRGQLVLVHGEAGVGKTRLVQEVIESADDVHLLAGHAYEADGTPPYQPLIEAMRSAHLAFESLEPPVAPVWLREVSRLVPEFGVQPALVPAGAGMPVEAEEARSRLFEGIARLICRLAEERSVILGLDDLHWADEATLEVVGYLTRAVSYQPVLIVSTYRTEEAGPTLRRLVRDLRRDGLVTQIAVNRLTIDEVTAMIRKMAGMKEGAERFSQRIYEQTAGNPFFVIEVIKSLFEQGLLREEPGGWATTWEDFASDYQTLPLPLSIREAVEARLERLDGNTQMILETAAVIRHPFAFSTVQTASGLSEIEALDAFDALLRAGLIQEIAVDIEGSTYDFSHPLVREVTYQDLSGARRQHLHCRVGQTLEATHLPSPNGVVDRLAYHFGLGGARDKALKYAIEAGHRARGLYAADAAIEHYQRALSFKPSVADEAEITAGLGDVYTLQGRHSEAIVSYRRALELAGDEPEIADLHRRIGRVYERGGDYEAALSHFSLGKDALADAGPSPTRARLDDGIALIHIREGRYDEAIDLCQHALDSLNGLGEKDTRQETAWLTNTLGSAYLSQGDYTAALDHFHRSLDLRTELEDLQGEATLHNNIGVVHYYRGDYDAARECYERSFSIKDDIGDVYGLATSHTNLGLTSMRLDASDVARSHLTQALKLCREIEAEGLLPEIYRLLAQLHLNTGDADGAAIYAEKSLETAQDLKSSALIGVAYRVLGEVAAAQDEEIEAHDHFEESHHIFAEAHEAHELAKTAATYGDALQAWGELDVAREQLQKAAEIFEASGADLRLERVQAALDGMVEAA